MVPAAQYHGDLDATVAHWSWNSAITKLHIFWGKAMWMLDFCSSLPASLLWYVSYRYRWRLCYAIERNNHIGSLHISGMGWYAPDRKHVSSLWHANLRFCRMIVIFWHLLFSLLVSMLSFHGTRCKRSRSEFAFLESMFIACKTTFPCPQWSLLVDTTVLGVEQRCSSAPFQCYCLLALCLGWHYKDGRLGVVHHHPGLSILMATIIELWEIAHIWFISLPTITITIHIL